jgi:hypothetical protein
MTRMSIELTDDQHRKIKVFASLQGKTIKEVVLENLFENIDKSLNKATLNAMEEIRTNKNLNSYKTVDDLFSKLNKKCS